MTYDTNILEQSELLSFERHRGLKYGIEHTMSDHTADVRAIALRYGLSEVEIIACDWHDGIEERVITYQEIHELYGREVAEIVYAVTDEEGRNRQERKEKTYPKIAANFKAVRVKICDRIANIKFSLAQGTNHKILMYYNERGDFHFGIEIHKHSIGDGIIREMVQEMIELYKQCEKFLKEKA